MYIRCDYDVRIVLCWHSKVEFFIALVHLSKISKVDMSHHSHIILWFDPTWGSNTRYTHNGGVCTDTYTTYAVIAVNDLYVNVCITNH